MTYAAERLLIVAGHAWQCPSCRRMLLEDPDGVLLRQGLAGEERSLFGQVAVEDWTTLTSLAKALGVSRTDLEAAMRHPRCRLRHF